MDALPDARREADSLGVVGRRGVVGRAGNVIYVAREPVARKATGILNRCLVRAGGKRMTLPRLR